MEIQKTIRTPIAIAVYRHFEGLSIRKIKERLVGLNKNRLLSTIYYHANSFQQENQEIINLKRKCPFELPNPKRL